MTLVVRNVSAIVKDCAECLRAGCNTRPQEEDKNMQLSTVVASAALVLAAALVAGHALGEDIPPQSPTKVTVQKKLDEREAQRRAAAADQQKRKADFERRCSKPLKTPYELEECRPVYRQM